MLASCCLVSAWRHPISLALSCQRPSHRLNAQVGFAFNKPVICPTVCTTHSLCHSDILPVLPSHYYTIRCQCLIHDVLLTFGRRKTVLVFRNSCSAHFLKRRSPLLLHFPTPSDPITPSQIWWSVPILALKSPRRMFVCPGCCRNHRIQIIIERL